MKLHQLSHKFQGAFVKGRRTTDHVFVLNTLLDKAKKQGIEIHCASVDCRRAYDTINRDKLLEKLVNYGVRPKYCQLIKRCVF